MNEGFGKDFYRKGNSVKRSGRFSEPPDSAKLKVAVLIPFPKMNSYLDERDLGDEPVKKWRRHPRTCVMNQAMEEERGA